MNTYTIPCVWQMYGTMQIEAESLEQAKEIALNPNTKLPNGSYIEDSFELDSDMVEEMNNL